MFSCVSNQQPARKVHFFSRLSIVTIYKIGACNKSVYFLKIYLLHYPVCNMWRVSKVVDIFH
jgi:hypothetical protein